jgi:3-dehydroquinate synthase
MKKISIDASGKYDVLIASGLLDRAGELVRAAAPRAETAAVITDGNVAANYLERVRVRLEDAGLRTVSHVVKSGEASKNGAEFLALLSFLAEKGMTRTDVVIALGGGMIGDLAGFTAASYMRGISCVQLPTTLLAAVDSSVGGKTAIDLPEGKNLAGAFCQPALVICDTETFKTLPDDIFRDGCAEVIKYAVLGDEAIFAHLSERGRNFDTERVAARCVEMKGEYVKSDEFDTGIRRMLNLGHTLGHAVEAESGFAVSHGCAVAIGLACVSRAAARRGLCAPECAESICALLEKFGLPTRTEYSIDVLARHMASDKKHVGSSIGVIVPERIGKCSILTMDDASLAAFMAEGL